MVDEPRSKMFRNEKTHTNINFFGRATFFLPMYQVHRFSVGCCKHAHIAQGAHDYVRDAFKLVHVGVDECS